MSIATQITRINNAKSNIRTAIIGKGVAVPSSAKIDTYASYVAQIPQGGGGGDIPMPQTLKSLTLDAYGKPLSFLYYGSEVPPSGYMETHSITSVTIDTETYAIGGSAFKGCDGLLNVEMLGEIGYIYANAFSGCTSLQSVIFNQISPPTFVGAGVFDDTNNCPIYCPAQSVDAYKAKFSAYASRIQGRS